MARWPAWLAIPVAALVLVWAAAGCRRMTPKNINEVRDEGRQRAASYDRGTDRARPAGPAGDQKDADRQQREEAAAKIRDDQQADAKVRSEYKIDDETGQPKEEPGED